MDFKTALRTAMAVRGINLTKLSETTGINKGTISHYMNGRTTAKQENVYKLSQALHISPAYLLGYSESMEASVELPPMKSTNELLQKEASRLLGLCDDKQLARVIHFIEDYIL